MRLRNMLRNSLFGLGSQFLIIIVGFFYQRVINLYMGKELVGVNGVISNIIAILSVSEMGISTAIVFHLYEALNDRNEKKIASLINIYRKAYLLFSGFIVVLGLVVTSFVPYLINGSGFSNSYLRFLFVLWVLKTAFSNILSYKRAILVADQKEYIVTIASCLISIINYLVCILIVVIWGDFILSFAINIVIEIIINLMLNVYIDKKYAFLRKYRRERLIDNTLKEIFSDIKNLFVSKLSSMLLSSTDNLIISSFISAGVVGVYSNYTMITLSLYNISRSISNAIQPSIGNLFLEKDHSKNFFMLRELTFVFSFIASTSATGIICFCSYFVGDFWLGEDFVLSKDIVLVLGINCFIYIISLPINVFMNASGKFKNIKTASISMALTNIIISLILVGPFGVLGVIIGTMVAYIVQFVLNVKYMICDYLSQNYKKYLFDIFLLSVLCVIDILVSNYIICFFYRNDSKLSFITAFLVCLILPSIITLVVFFRNWRVKNIVAIMKETYFTKKVKL